MSALHALAAQAGLMVDWRDATGQRQRVSDETLIAVLDALGLPAATDQQVEESRARLRADARAAEAALITAQAGHPAPAPTALKRSGRAQLHLESGERLDFSPLDGIPPVSEPGYHRIEADGFSISLAVAPSHAFTVADAAGRRIWGPAVQIYALRDRRGEAFGDFGALAAFARNVARRGADALAISPVHALFPADASRYSPYGPSSRLFLNVLLADPSQLDGTGWTDEGGDLIDWKSAIPERMARLRRHYEARSEEVRRAVEAFRAARGDELDLHARYDALHAHFLAQQGARGWREWPDSFHDPRGAAVAAFADAHADEVGFHVFLQWLADRSLASAQASARESGMALGLIADMAVGVDPGGSEAWSKPGALLSGLSVGAPPDALGPQGQDWGVTSFSPQGLKRTGFEDFIATLRASLRHAGGIRIDHAMGLRRLWVVPHGASSTQGAYLRYPETDMMRLLALESHRAGAIVIGEDLGTVPPGFRGRMDELGFAGMRVLWFERARSGGFRAPKRWPRGAAAMTSTHDLPTVAGWWRGRDIEWNWRLGRVAPGATEADDVAGRARDRTRLWRACRKAGVTDGSEPPPDRPDEAVTAALAYVASTPAEIAIFPVEDLLGLAEQPNLPGTVDEHPNWKRRLPALAEDMLDAPEIAHRIAALNRTRRR